MPVSLFWWRGRWFICVLCNQARGHKCLPVDPIFHILSLQQTSRSAINIKTRHTAQFIWYATLLFEDETGGFMWFMRWSRGFFCFLFFIAWLHHWCCCSQSPSKSRAAVAWLFLFKTVSFHIVCVWNEKFWQLFCAWYPGNSFLATVCLCKLCSCVLLLQHA